MKAKTTFSFIVATLVALFAMSLVCAGTLNVNINEVSVNDVVLVSGSTNLAGTAGEVVPVTVKFTANEDLQDLKVSTWIDGYKSDISAETSRFNAVNASEYIKRLSLTLPSVNDMNDITEPLTLYVRIADKNDANEQTYQIVMQRDSYSVDLLSVDVPSSASAGEILALDVVLRNIGASELQDTFVTANIPELGISKKVYFGDLAAQDCTNGCDKEDAKNMRVYLVIPGNAVSGDYTLEVKASNYDTSSTVKKVLHITGVNAQNNTAVTGQVIVTEGSSMPSTVVILTVILVIVFVVLLIVLIVLLTKKPAQKSEDFGETSYY